jgi:integrase/recombinase XerD
MGKPASCSTPRPLITLKGVRDRAILATLLYHGIRREKLCSLHVRDMQSRQGVLHFRAQGKRDEVRFVPAHVLAQRLIEAYLTFAGTAPKSPACSFVRSLTTAPAPSPRCIRILCESMGWRLRSAPK